MVAYSLDGRAHLSARSYAGGVMGAQSSKTAMFRAVKVLHDTGTAFLCLIGTEQVWVPLTEIRYGSELARIGDQGRLIVSRWFAQNLGLGG
jgi:hypothetical protein